MTAVISVPCCLAPFLLVQIPLCEIRNVGRSEWLLTGRGFAIMHKTLSFLSGVGVAYIGYLSISDGLTLRVASLVGNHGVEQPHI